MQIKIIEEHNNIDNFINFIKTTDFYKEVVGALYLDREEETVYYQPKTYYSRRDENCLWDALDTTEYPFMIDDISGYEKDFSNLEKIGWKVNITQTKNGKLNKLNKYKRNYPLSL